MLAFLCVCVWYQMAVLTSRGTSTGWGMGWEIPHQVQKREMQSPALGRNKPRHQERLGADHLESSSAEKALQAFNLLHWWATGWSWNVPFHQRSLKACWDALEGWSNTGTGYPERLWSLCLQRSSRLAVAVWSLLQLTVLGAEAWRGDLQRGLPASATAWVHGYCKAIAMMLVQLQLFSRRWVYDDIHKTPGTGKKYACVSGQDLVQEFAGSNGTGQKVWQGYCCCKSCLGRISACLDTTDHCTWHLQWGKEHRILVALKVVRFCRRDNSGLTYLRRSRGLEMAPLEEDCRTTEDQQPQQVLQSFHRGKKG